MFPDELLAGTEIETEKVGVDGKCGGAGCGDFSGFCSTAGGGDVTGSSCARVGGAAQHHQLKTKKTVLDYSRIY